MRDESASTLVESEPQRASPIDRRPTVAVSGAGGLVGRALVARLVAEGRRIRRLVRRDSSTADEILWDPVGGTIEAHKLERIDAVVHLAGENIAGARWTEKQRRRIRESRVRGTRLIAETLARLERPPRVLVSASAIGFYGDRGHEPLDETSPPGSGFLAEVCQEWEAAAAPAAEAGLRLVLPRIGIVLSREGGALVKMLPVFRLGLGGRVGDGRQYMSWITLDDLVAAIDHALLDPELQGPVNVVAPAPATNAELTRALGAVLGRPTLVPVPAPAIGLLMGEMGRELLLAGA
jgi:uncharacterized protein (TIGR01777 family)